MSYMNTADEHIAMPAHIHTLSSRGAALAYKLSGFQSSDMAAQFSQGGSAVDLFLKCAIAEFLRFLKAAACARHGYLLS